MKKEKSITAAERETISVASEMVMNVATEFRDVIQEQTKILLTGRNIQMISTLLHLKKNKEGFYAIDAERIFQLGDKGILDSLIEDCQRAREYVQTKSSSVQFPQHLPEAKKEKVNLKAYALLHVYWSMFDKTKRITDTNKLTFSQQYGYSQNTLKKQFDNYSDSINRKPDGESKKSVEPFLKNLSDAMEMLRTCCPKGFEVAKDEYEKIRTKIL